MIRFEFIDTNFSLSNRESVRNWIKSIISKYGRRVGEINYIFSNDDYILEVNKSYLGHDYYTDIITFDTSSYSEVTSRGNADKISADIFISIDTVVANAQEYGATCLEELYRVMAHGILHLVGFDDHSDEDSAKMREAEAVSIELQKSLNNGKLIPQKSFNI